MNDDVNDIIHRLRQKIKNGDYIRTADGIIGQIANNFMENTKMKLKDGSVINALKIVKHSQNIIDIIEVGDYVNGKYVYDVFEAVTTGGKLVKVDCMRGYYKPEEIEEIVTHEQFERAKFVVGGKGND